MKVVVGSQNPVKIQAVTKAFAVYFGEVTIEGISVSSGVSSQPMSAQKAYEGAYNRAKACIETVQDADFGVGVEGGIERFSFGDMTSGFIVIIDRKGQCGFGTSARMQVPEPVMQKITSERKELGSVMAQLTGIENIKQQGGMFGVFSKGVVTREDAYFQGVIFALSRFVSNSFYHF